MTNANESRKQDSPHSIEPALAETPVNRLSGVSGYSPDELLHQLQVSQVELETQNESLSLAQAALEESRDRYIDLYDFAPVGYLTVNERGLICEANLTACALLGVDRSNLLHRRFVQFIANEECDRWQQRFQHSMQQGEQANFEVLLRRGEGSLFHAALNSRRVTSRDKPMLRITLSDVSKRVADRREVAMHRDHLEHLVAVRTAQLTASEDKVSGLLGQSLAGVCWRAKENTQ